MLDSLKSSDFFLVCKYLVLGDSQQGSDLLVQILDFIDRHTSGQFIVPEKLLEEVLLDYECTRILITQYRRRHEKLRLRSSIQRFPSHSYFTSCQFSQIIRDMMWPYTTHAKIQKSESVVAFGSCFARNVTRYLQRLGVNAETMLQVEDFNNPLINAELLTLDYTEIAPESFIVTGDSDFAQKVRETDRCKALLANSPTSMLDWSFAQRFGKLKQLIASASMCIITIGTAFATMADNELVIEMGSSRRHKSELLSPDVICDSLKKIHGSIKRINSKCLIVYTLSPIPVYAAYGGVNSYESVYERDCISKSVCRVALNKFMQYLNDPLSSYYPSYEMVRWIAPFLANLSIWEDPRHLDLANIADPITALFAEKYIQGFDNMQYSFNSSAHDSNQATA